MATTTNPTTTISNTALRMTTAPVHSPWGPGPQLWIAAAPAEGGRSYGTIT
jgi:hypothetical protein